MERVEDGMLDHLEDLVDQFGDDYQVGYSASEEEEEEDEDME